MDSESDEDLSSTVSGYGPPIVTGRKAFAPEQVLRGYEGSETVRKIQALQAQVQKSKVPTETYNKLNELSKLLGKTSSQQQGVVKDLRDKLRILEGDSDADAFRTALLEAKDKEEEQGELIKDAIERAKELENTAIRYEPYLYASYIRRATDDARLAVARAFIAVFPGSYVEKTLMNGAEVKWGEFRNAFCDHAMGFMVKEVHGEGYCIRQRYDVISRAEIDPRSRHILLTNAIESDFEKKTAKYRPKKNDGFLPVFLQFFIPKLVYELVNIKRLLSTSDDMLKALWTAPESGPKHGLEQGTQDRRQASGLSRGKVRSRDSDWQGYSSQSSGRHGRDQRPRDSGWQGYSAQSSGRHDRDQRPRDSGWQGFSGQSSGRRGGESRDYRYNESYSQGPKRNQPWDWDSGYRSRGSQTSPPQYGGIRERIPSTQEERARHAARHGPAPSHGNQSATRSSDRPGDLEGSLTNVGQNAYNVYVTLVKAIGLLLDTDVIKLALTSNNNSFLRVICNQIDHAGREVREEELMKLCKNNVDGVFTVQMREDPGSVKARLGIPANEVQPAVNKMIDIVTDKYCAQDDTALKDDIASFIEEQETMGESSVISTTGLYFLKKWAGMVSKDGSNGDSEPMELESEAEERTLG